MSKQSISGIYIILHQKSGKIYIGQAQNVSKRWGEHKRALNHNQHINRHLQHAWNKYGAKAFQFKILERCAINQLDEREQHYLDLYMPKGLCYNINPNAKTTRGMECSEETKRKISIANTGKSPDKTTRRKLSEAMKGRSFTAETRQKMSEANKGRPISDKTRQQWNELLERQKGAKKSPEHAQHISEALKGHRVSEETRRKISEAAKARAARKRDQLE